MISFAQSFIDHYPNKWGDNHRLIIVSVMPIEIGFDKENRNGLVLCIDSFIAFDLFPLKSFERPR